MSSNSSLIPSTRDLIMVFPRLAQRASSFAFSQLPDQADSVWSKIWHGGSVIADATSVGNATVSVTKTSAAAFVQKTAISSAAKAAATGADEANIFSWFSSTLHLESIRGFGSMFTYFSSRWALATFTVSILLNRTHFYASSRQNLRLRWKARLCLYTIPIILVLIQTHWLLQAVHCQTSPAYPLYRYGDPDKRPSINFGGEGGFMYQLSSMLLFWQDDKTSCAAMNMSIQNEDMVSVMGTFSFVWPFFITICISQFVETLACALQGRQPMAETGMTTFEHSLAFAECEAMISNALGLGLFSRTKSNSVLEPADSSGDSSDAIFLTRSMILQRLNVPSELLLIALISCLSHLSSAVLAVSGKRHKYRLINTGIWSMCYLSAFIWSFARVMQEPLVDQNDLGMLRFPTVCIVGFIPHMLILGGMLICSFIYGLALLMTIISPPPNSPPDLTFRQRVSLAYNNMQANVQFSSASSLRLNWQEDFYSNLLKIGFNILTAASEAVYLNESNRVKVHDMTWLERKRLQEWSASQRETSGMRASELGLPVMLQDMSTTVNAQSGYAHERKSRAKGKNDALGADTGLGAATRRNRWEMVVGFLSGVVQISARTTALLLTKLGIGRRPGWLFRYASKTTAVKITARRYRAARPNALDFWLIDENGTLTLPKDREVDVEAETRQRMGALSTASLDEAVDEKLYTWWKSGGWWGDIDTSGDYAAAPANPDDDDENDDLTSVISDSAASSAWESASNSSGRRTPTLADPFPSEPASDLSLINLARLLDPHSPEEREEALLLSSHLQSPKPMTRAAFRRRQASQRSRVLLPPSTAEADEEAALESYILARRRDTAAKNQQGGGERAWASGADGLGAGGPVCVVCQSAPRSVLVWPCGCLSVCDECRVGVAARNFGTCLCCRTGVVAYSKLYVP